jgi:hypothetical protein
MRQAPWEGKTNQKLTFLAVKAAIGEKTMTLRI